MDTNAQIEANQNQTVVSYSREVTAELEYHLKRSGEGGHYCRELISKLPAQQFLILLFNLEKTEFSFPMCCLELGKVVFDISSVQ